MANKKLTEKDLESLKKRVKYTPSLRQLAKIFGVSHETIRKALLEFRKDT